jgi:hypothetical protein
LEKRRHRSGVMKLWAWSSPPGRACPGIAGGKGWVFRKDKRQKKSFSLKEDI